jgi:hypothetical protein
MAIPKFPDERLGRLPDKFMKALGHLQYAHTSLEVAIASHINLLVTRGYDPQDNSPLLDRVNAVLGGMRMDAAKDTLKRLLRVSEAPQNIIGYVGRVCGHVTDVSYFRNRLTHHQTTAWFRKRGEFVNSDAGLAREYEKAVTFTFGYDALDAARYDLHAAMNYLDQAIPDIGDPAILEPLAWQYKPSMLTH